MTMTSRQRVEAALRHEPPDRTPIFEYILTASWVDELLGRRYAIGAGNWESLVSEKGWEDAVRQLAVDRLDIAYLLGHDMLYVKPNPLPCDTKPFGNPAISQDPLPAFDDPVRAVKQRNEKWAQSIEPHPDSSLLIYSVLREEMRRRDMDLPILAPAYEHGVWTDVNLMQTMLLDPETAHQHFSLATRKAHMAIDQYAAHGIDQVAIGGDFAGNRPVISPQSYEEFIVPGVSALARHAHQANMWAVNGSDGNLWYVIENFLYGCGVDGYIEIDMHAGMDMGRLKQQFGKEKTFYGNLDCGNILSFGSQEEVKQHVIDCLEAGMGNGGHILCTSNAVTESVPLENYLSVVATYRDMFSLPKLQLP